MTLEPDRHARCSRPPTSRAAIEVAHYGVDAPLYCVLLCLEDWAIQWVPNAEHQAFTGMDLRTVVVDELPPWSLLALVRCHGNSSSLANHVRGTSFSRSSRASLSAMSTRMLTSDRATFCSNRSVTVTFCKIFRSRCDVCMCLTSSSAAT